MTAKTATTPPDGETVDEHVDEVAELLQEPVPGLILMGVPCQTRRLKTREFLKLMRIITDGLGGRIALMALAEDADDEEALASQMAGAILQSIPYAEDAVLDFLYAMVEPVSNDPKDHAVLVEYMGNPGLEDLALIITHIMESEVGELSKMGKAFRSWWQTSGMKGRYGTTQ